MHKTHNTTQHNKAVIFLLLFAMCFVFSNSVHAQTLGQQPCYSDRGGYCIKVVAPKAPPAQETGGFAAGIVGLEFLGESANLGDLLANLYYFLLGLVGISALVMFVWGGIEYMLAGDRDPSKAKERMKNAVYGLVLALTSWLILYTINPDLVARLNINLDPIAPQQRTDGGPPGAGIGCASDGDQDCGSGLKCVAFQCVPN